MTDEALGEVTGLRADVKSLTGAVNELVKRNEQSERTVKLLRYTVGGLLVSLVLTAAVAAYGVVTNHRLKEYSARQAEHSACQAAYNENLNERTRILTDVGANERKAERARSDAFDAVFLDSSLLKPANERTPADAKRVQDLFLTYRSAAVKLRQERVAADAARAANPVPPPPSSVCGG